MHGCMHHIRTEHASTGKDRDARMSYKVYRGNQAKQKKLQRKVILLSP